MLSPVLLTCLLAAPALPYAEGFEDPAALTAVGWPASAAQGVVTEQPFAGQRCLRVGSAAGAPSYVSLYVPVEAGKWYHGEVRIRCAGVVKHAAGNQNRGAVIFGQFAGAAREWVGGGSFPAGLHGDQPWTRREFAYTRPIPDNVKYLQLMLGVEGQGTAWFDDLLVEEVTSVPGPDKVTPAAGATIDIRRPEFRWRPEPGIKAMYGVELCRQEDFAGEVHQAGTGRDRVRPAEPLTPGRWYWRVVRREGDVAPPPSRPAWFEVAADARFWPPVIEPRWGWSDEARPVLACRVAPAEAAYEVALTIDGQEAQTLPAEGDVRRWRPAVDLPAALHDVELICRDGRDQVTVTGMLNTQRPDSRVTLSDQGTALVDGEPFFPLGAYRDPSDTLTDFSGLLEAGFNTTHSYTFEGNASIEQAAAYLDAADRAGLKVFLGLSRAWVQAQDTGAMEHWVASLMNRKGLLTWYLFDEPASQGVPVESIAMMYQAVKRIDPFHPASLLLARDSAYAAYAPECDIFWADPYPVGRHPLTMVSDRARQARLAAGGKPIWIVLQAFDWAYWPDPQGRIKEVGQPTAPTEAQSRVMAHLALAEGAQGLIWYWQPNSKWHQVKDAPRVWAGVKTVVGELRQAMPLLLAPRTLNDALQLPEPLLGWASTAGRQQVLYVINPTDQAVEADVTAAARVATGGRRPELQLEPVRLTLAPLEVKRMSWTVGGER